MKCVIDEFGMLVIDGIEKKCPYSSKRCGTWCALFGTDNRKDKKYVHVELCKKTWYFLRDDFTEKPLCSKTFLEEILEAQKVT